MVKSGDGEKRFIKVLSFLVKRAPNLKFVFWDYCLSLKGLGVGAGKEKECWGERV